MKGIVTVTTLSGYVLEAHKIDGETLKRQHDDGRRNADQYASDARAAILEAAMQHYGRGRCYVFAAWEGAMCIEPNYIKKAA